MDPKQVEEVAAPEEDVADQDRTNPTSEIPKNDAAEDVKAEKQTGFPVIPNLPVLQGM